MDADSVLAELDASRRPELALDRLGSIRLSRRATAALEVRGLLQDAFARSPYQRYGFVQGQRGRIGPSLAALTDAERARLVEALLPGLAPSVAAAWDILPYRPYQQGLARRPFRSPGSAQTLADVRGRWLLHVSLLLGEYDADAVWVAERAAHLGGWYGGPDLGWLLAGAIEAGGATGNAVLDVLKDSATGDHETGQMGRHVTQALLSCGRPDAWGFVEQMLLAAQRQEGLRQAILESVDEAHPEAFRRMLRLLLDEGLTRFSSVVRATDTWFGFLWEGSSAGAVDPVLEKVLGFLDDETARREAVEGDGAEAVFLGLWAGAFRDVEEAVPAAAGRLDADSPEVRFAATHFLVQALWTSALPHLAEALADPDLRVAARALDAFAGPAGPWVDGERLFDRLEELMQRLPERSRTLEAVLWPWTDRPLDRAHVAAAMADNAEGVPAERVLPYVPDLTPPQRAWFVRKLAGIPRPWERADPVEPRPLEGPGRSTVLELMGDPSADVRRAAFEALDATPVRPDEVERLVDLLGRKSGDLRSGCVARLVRLGDRELLTAADALLADRAGPRRIAGLELLREASRAGRLVEEGVVRAAEYRSGRSDLTAAERPHVEALLAESTAAASRTDALGLIDPDELSAWPAPGRRSMELDTAGARASLADLADLVLRHQEHEVQRPSGESVLLVESAFYGFGPHRRESLADREAALPLLEVWKEWARSRPGSLRDPDGLELLRVLLAEQDSKAWSSGPVRRLTTRDRWSRARLFLGGIVEWSVVWDPPAGGMDFLLGGLEDSLADFEAADFDEIVAQGAAHGVQRFVMYHERDRNRPAVLKTERARRWLDRARWWRELFPASVSDGHAGRLYGLLRWFQQRSEGWGALAVSVRDFADAYRSGAADSAELVDLLVGRFAHARSASLLLELSRRRPPGATAELPEIAEVVDRCRRRIVEVETRRGDRPTAASALALELRWTGGLETVSRALEALGPAGFARSGGLSGNEDSRQETLSHLVLRSAPREHDSPSAFAEWAAGADLGDERLVDLAVYAPQWADHVAHVLGWPGLVGAVWWLHAHTKDDRSWRVPELKEVWAAEVSERTSLASGDLLEGAVDVAWFAEVHALLGPDCWPVLDRAAKYAASGAGHARARLFAKAMLGEVAEEELAGRIEKSRHQDSVRAVGLLPLPEGESRAATLLARYRLLQDFLRGSRKFGSQRRQSEARAVAIGLANLARTAGFRDPQRLQWAMEREAVEDLRAGPVVRTSGDVAVALSVDPEGTPSLSVRRGDKALKAIPAAARKAPGVAELQRRLKELRQQGSRVRASLEEAMCRGDTFAGAELKELLAHPLLGPVLRRLVFVGEGAAGYPEAEGAVLRDAGGAAHAVGRDEPVRVAHPHDLWERGDWTAWQRECFRTERVQPFKQVFREFYPVTEGERGAQHSRRYAGHQVGPRKALALLGGRGWTAHPEEGVARTWHEDGLTARLRFQEAFYTPADVEGLTLEDVVFTRKGEWTELPLADIPPRVFSEAMRDLDLVVSVAHQGGVDPEATASTVEMRAALVRETSELLGLSNVDVGDSHVVVRGERASYSVHLGSANAMVLPGVALPLVAVHSQHRGRLFLPFADDDPRTAEVLSKVLLLARDVAIRDPAVLERIRAAGG